MPRSGETIRLPARLEALAPRMLSWLGGVERRLSGEGRPLSGAEQDIARAIGVNAPERVRVVITQCFPMPADPGLRREAGRLGLDSLPERGRAVGYLILLKPAAADDRATLAHELAHVAQTEQLGREAFFRRYFAELDRFGYQHAPLERHARAVARRYRN